MRTHIVSCSWVGQGKLTYVKKLQCIWCEPAPKNIYRFKQEVSETLKEVPQGFFESIQNSQISALRHKQTLYKIEKGTSGKMTPKDLKILKDRVCQNSPCPYQLKNRTKVGTLSGPHIIFHVEPAIYLFYFFFHRMSVELRHLTVAYPGIFHI